MIACLSSFLAPIYPFNFDVLIAIISIITMSGPGCLIRVALSKVSLDWPWVIPSLLPNLVGCFVMGFHEGFAQSHWVSHTFEDKYVKVGIATGFTGSVTTFSSFNFEIATLLIRDDHEPQVGRYFSNIANTFIGGIICYFNGEAFAKCIFRPKDSAIMMEPYKSTSQKDLDEETLYIKSPVNGHGHNIHDNIDDIEESTPINVVNIDHDGNDGNAGDIEMSGINRSNSNGESNGHIRHKSHNKDQKMDTPNYKMDSPNYKMSVSESDETTKLQNTLQIEMEESHSDSDESAGGHHHHPKVDTRPRSQYMMQHWIITRWVIAFLVLYTATFILSFQITDRMWEAICFAPLGALTRWYVGKLFNNKSERWMPLGTFIVNVFGSGLFTLIHNISQDKGDVLWAYHEMTNALLLSGYCGCLTLVTFDIFSIYMLHTITLILFCGWIFNQRNPGLLLID